MNLYLTAMKGSVIHSVISKLVIAPNSASEDLKRSYYIIDVGRGEVCKSMTPVLARYKTEPNFIIDITSYYSPLVHFL